MRAFEYTIRAMRDISMRLKDFINKQINRNNERSNQKNPT